MNKVLKSIGLFLVLFFLLFLGATRAEKSGKVDKAKLRDELQAALDRFATPRTLPGATLGIVLPDDSIIRLASGLADIEKNIKMTPEDRMFSGSIGKTYVSAVLLQLVEEKKLSIQDPVKKYLGEKPWFSRLPNADALTIYMLLTHTGGLTEYAAKPGVWETVRKFPDKTWTPADRLEFIFDDAPVHPPGNGWSYSDSDYIILGYIIEKVTGNTYYSELEKRVLKPLKLTETTPADKRELKGLMPGYSDLDAPFNIYGKVVADGKYFFNPQMEWTGGGLISTSADLAVWAKRLYGGKFLSKTSLKKMLTPVSLRTGKPDKEGYGLGVFVWSSEFGAVYGHSGFVPGYNSVMAYVPRYGFSVGLQINSDTAKKTLKKPVFQMILEFINIVAKAMEQKHP